MAVTTANTETAVSDWVVCDGCRTVLYRRRFQRELRVCPECGHHHPLAAPERLRALLDPDSVQPLGPQSLPAADPLGFVDTEPYPQRLARAQASTGLDEAVLCVQGRISGHPVVAAVMDFRFLGGSLGCALGELLTLAAEEALRSRTPFLMVTASGGARMQEGALALMQMAKTSSTLARLDEAGVLTLSLITDPTFGGVAASFATLADVVVAERGARLGFAGPRVIEQTIRQRLPEGFQRAEALLGRGLLDGVYDRSALRPALARLLAAGGPRPRPYGDAAPPAATSSRCARALVTEPRLLPPRDAWTVVVGSRRLERPTLMDHASRILEDFEELHGDRLGGDCAAIVGGTGRLNGLPVMLMGHQKAHHLRELAARNFAMATPAGYRKAGRLMRLAAKLDLPVITLVDTPGAYPGREAEERGQAMAIAQSLRLMSTLPVPVVCAVIGEGGSGGALGLAVADKVLICENATYSVISPEGCAAILWQDPTAVPQAAAALGLVPRELLRHGVVDGVIREPAGGAHTDHDLAAELLGGALHEALAACLPLDRGELLHRRWQRYRRMGAHLGQPPPQPPRPALPREVPCSPRS